MMMRFVATMAMALMVVGCSRGVKTHSDAAAVAASPTQVQQQGPGPGAMVDPAIGYVSGGYRGFDRNDYPGDDTMQKMMREHVSFAFTGYWLTPPPGETTNSWTGKREFLRNLGWGFLLLADGKLEKEILAAQKIGTTPDALGKKDAADAVAAAKSEGFPAHAVIFLDQEEGGRLTDVQAKYLLAWTEAVAATSYKAGVYASGQPVPDDENITTVKDIRARVKAGHLHEVEIFDTQDACGPSTGCTMTPKPLSDAGEPNLNSWQYSQSPQRPEITKSCAKTYTAGKCYAPGFPKVFLDLDLAASPDPSAGR